MLKVLREISELAGLKRKEIMVQQRVLDEQRLDVVVSFAHVILNEYTKRIEGLLTKKGKLEIEANSADWQGEIILENADILEAEVESWV